MEHQPAPVFVAGPASWNELVYLDALPEPRSQTLFARRHLATVGGTSAGKALNLRALGRAVTLRTVLGSDDVAPRVEDVLRAAGVALLVEPDPDGRTERHLNLMGASGERLSIYLQAPGDVPRGETWEAAVAALGDARAVVIDLAVPALPLLREARRLGKDVWCDVHDYDGEAVFHREFLDAATFLFLSSDRLPGYRAFMEERVAAGARLVVCTHGARGASALTADGEWFDVPAVTVEHVVDTNGAGDAFFAGFLDAHLSGATVAEALSAGAVRGALCVQSPDIAPTV
ncbi:carbohydrate kinase family protein [Oerskovia sp. NPDC060287]|uniref:carbohydrate kinase family protein n=1 Tax=Oerskovia sp. NPDC060287 TaxID=3347095 RepID=UPI00365C03DE